MRCAIECPKCGRTMDQIDVVVAVETRFDQSTDSPVEDNQYIHVYGCVCGETVEIDEQELVGLVGI